MKKRWTLLLVLVCITGSAIAQDDEPKGLLISEPGVLKGYNLFSPLNAATTYLMDNEGRVIHTWESQYRPGNLAYLLDNGTILRPASFGHDGNGTFHGGGAGYRIEQIAWNGERLWEFIYADDNYLMHHDVEPLPNGNVLILAWEMKTAEEAIAAGRNPELLADGELWPEHIVEVKPIRPSGGEIVWEWHLWDHVVQDFDESKPNYGDVAEHPELVELNPLGHWMDNISEEELAELEALGYAGDDPDAEEGDGDDDKDDDRDRGSGADWHHANAIAYNAELDQIAISALGNSEIWILDHGITTEEARGHTAGRYGKGGDLLYRWGNPFAYRGGPEIDQQLFSQHNVHWVPEGYPGAGNLLIFNNGRGRADDMRYSSVVEITPPIKPDGSYFLDPGQAFGPAAPTWEYTAPNKEDFHSGHISGAERQPNGNTLICEGASGTFFEVTAGKEIVWRYVNPVAVAERRGENGDEEEEDEPRNDVFRVNRYGADHPGLKDKDLTPGPLLSEYIKTHPPRIPRERDEDS